MCFLSLVLVLELHKEFLVELHKEFLMELHKEFLLVLRPKMIQTRGQGMKITTINIIDTTTDNIKSRWIRRGISPETDGRRPKDPLVQPWTFTEQAGTPQKDNFTNTTETRLACGIYTVLNSIYAVRNWEIDFVQQTHIRQARNWMIQ